MSEWIDPPSMTDEAPTITATEVERRQKAWCAKVDHILAERDAVMFVKLLAENARLKEVESELRQELGQRHTELKRFREENENGGNEFTMVNLRNVEIARLKEENQEYRNSLIDIMVAWNNPFWHEKVRNIARDTLARFPGEK